MGNLYGSYCEWRREVENYNKDAGIYDDRSLCGTHDCGESAAREDFSNYIGLEKMIGFEEMLKFEREYNKKNNTVVIFKDCSNKIDIETRYESIEEMHNDKIMFYTQSELSDLDQEDYNYIMEEHYKNDEGMPCKYEYVYIK